MLPPAHLGITLGPLFRHVADGAVWRDDAVEECFPPRQYIADEYERYVAFAVAQGQFDRLLPRLRARRSERDAAVSELAVAFMFHRDGFSILEWEPFGADRRRGEYRLHVGDGVTIFVEVKRPRWEGELSPEERAAHRQLPKYIGGEGRFVDSVTPLRIVCDNALPKLTGHESSLLVVADDLFLGYQENSWAAKVALYAPQLGVEGYSATSGPFLVPAFSVLGGVMTFWHDRQGNREFDQASYGHRLYMNPNAQDAVRLPERRV